MTIWCWGGRIGVDFNLIIINNSKIGFTIESDTLSPDKVAGIFYPSRRANKVMFLTNYYLGNKFISFSPSSKYLVYKGACFEGMCGIFIEDSELLVVKTVLNNAEYLDSRTMDVDFIRWISDTEVEYKIGTELKRKSFASGAEDYGFEDRSGGSLGDTTEVVDIRYGKHEDYERVVIEFDRAWIPSYTISQVSNSTPLLNVRSEDIVPSLGVPYRVLIGMGDTYTREFDHQKLPLGPKSFIVESIQLYNGGDHTYTGVLVGLNETTPYRVFTLESPSRIVVDFSTKLFLLLNE